MKEIIKKSGGVSVKFITSNDAPCLRVEGNQRIDYMYITPVRATLMIQALREYLDALGDAAPVDYEKPIA